MKAFQNPDMFQKFAQFGVQATGSIVATGVVVFLVLAWLVTSPMIRLIDQLVDKRKEKTKNK
jgi:hypothetical protein